MTATCPSVRVRWRHLANTIELVQPSVYSESTTDTANGSVQSFLHSLCMAESAYTLQWAPVSTRIAPSHGGSSGPPMQHMMLSAQTSPQPKRHLDRFSRLCTNDRGVSLYFTMVCLFSLKIASSESVHFRRSYSRTCEHR